MGWTVRGSNPGRRERIFSALKVSGLAVEPTQPPIQWVLCFLLGVKQPGHVVDHSPPSSAEVKREWSYTFAFPVYLHGIDTDSCTFSIFGG